MTGSGQRLTKRLWDAPRWRPRRGGSSVEYMLVLALVVIPVALLVPMLTRMVSIYGERVFAVIRSPFG